MFYFQIRMNVTNDNKRKAREEDGETNDILKCTHDELIKEIINKNYKCRIEYILDECDDDFNLFFDIDKYEKDINDFNIDLCYTIKRVIKKLLKISNEKNANLEKILQCVYGTKTTKPNANSYHIYVPLLRIKTSDVSHLSGIIKKMSENLPIDLDTQVYRQNLNFRFPYSVKDSTSTFYHKIIKLNILDKEIDEDYYLENYDEIKNINFKNYSIRIKNKESIQIDLNPKQEIETDNSIPLYGVAINNSNTNKFSNKYLRPDSPYTSIPLKQLLKIIFGGINYDIWMQVTDTLHIPHDENIEIGKLLTKNNPIMFTFNYDRTGCLFCKKKEHKQKHSIYLCHLGFIVQKNNKLNAGNLMQASYNCSKSAYYYQYSIESFIDFLISDNSIKVCEDKIIIFSNFSGWNICSTKEEITIKIKELILFYKPRFLNADYIKLSRATEKTIHEYVMSHKNVLPNLKMNVFSFKFNNGIINLLTGEFLQFKDSKHIINVFRKTDYDYKRFEDYTEKEQEHYAEFLKIINRIIPDYYKDENNVMIENIERINMDKVFAYSLCYENRELLIVFRGPGGVGKTTILSALESVFTSSNVAEIVNLSKKKSDSSSPDPFRANMAMKPLVRIRELKHIDEMILKGFTGSKQASRGLYSGETTTIVKGMLITDTNYIVINDSKLSMSRRLVIIDFAHNDLMGTGSSSDVFTMDKAKHYTQKTDETIKIRIEDGEFALDTFHYCYLKLKDYMKENIRLIPTFEKNPMNVYTEEFLKKSFVHSFTIADPKMNFSDMEEIIEKSVIDQYTIKKVVANENIKCIIFIKNEYVLKLFNVVESMLNMPDDTKESIRQTLSKGNTLQPFILIHDLTKSFRNANKDKLAAISKENTIYSLLREHTKMNK